MIEIIKKMDEGIISNIQWKAQDCDANSLLFYKINNLEAFKKHLSESLCHTCIALTDQELSDERVVVLAEKEWCALREQALDKLYPLDPSVKMLGVTGTNGKTTTTDLLRQLCVLNNIPVTTVGTLGVYNDNDKQEDFSLTSPDYIDLRKVITARKGIVCVELSSHALAQKRFSNLSFDGIAWSSFTQDHLDYHKTMEVYFQAKMLAFTHLKEGAKVFIPETQVELLAKIIDPRVQKVKPAKGEGAFFKAEYNQENLALALSLLKAAGAKLKMVKPLNPPPGRFNIVEWGKVKIIIDFAHSPGGIESLCNEIKKSFPKEKLFTIFGCGGDRDKAKRPLMGESACKYSDFVVVTSDNPRTESPSEIIKDILPGLSGNWHEEVSREEAIRWAMSKAANTKTILLIAGKGHENYIDINNQKIPYSDRKVVEEYINDNP